MAVVEMVRRGVDLHSVFNDELTVAVVAKKGQVRARVRGEAVVGQRQVLRRPDVEMEEV
jgi:hypothetical protein